MIVFALRHRTAGLMPQRMNRTGNKGWTHWPEQQAYEDRIPRLFATEAAAQRAKSAWLKGRWEPEYTYGDEFYGYTVRCHDIGRKPEDLEVIQMELA